MDIKLVSYIWQRLLQENPIPVNGVVVEVAPGYEKKIGDALALIGFTGTVILIEPDSSAAAHVEKLYKQILPRASVKLVRKFLQDVQIGQDIPSRVDALLSNHPFDDMAVAFAMRGKEPSLFSKEREAGWEVPPSIKKLYDSVSNRDYIHGVLATIVLWKDFVQKLKPDLFIISQYPSQKLALKQLTKRQNSGFIVIELMRDYYENYLKQQYWDKSFGRQGDPAWWIIARKPYIDLASDLAEMPLAMQRLGKSIFVPQTARRLDPKDYEIVYTDQAYFKNRGYEGDLAEQVRNFAIALNYKNPASKPITVYADRQKDSTGIGLSGNLGSGRAVYYGKNFNVMGVGKTTLCVSLIPSHSTGKMELVGSFRRVVLSRWMNHFTKNAVHHPVVIALKETEQYKWSANPIPSALLVRIDDGALDRPSHIEYSPSIAVDFPKVLDEYAKLDAQYFAYRILMGAWSVGNYSLTGHLIDPETVSFTKYRGPYHSASGKYSENLFGYEGAGFIKILRQLAKVKGIKNPDVEKQFSAQRRRYLGNYLLSLLGVDDARSPIFFSKHSKQVLALSDQFEKLAKKISPQKTSLNLYNPVPDGQDPALLDMSNLFRHLAGLYNLSSKREERALNYLIRKTALAQVKPGIVYEPQLISQGEVNQGEIFIKEKAVVTHKELRGFLSETKNFIRALFKMLDALDSEKCLPRRSYWNDQLKIINRNFPSLYELNEKLKYWVEEYRSGRINPEMLGAEIEKLCELPDYPIGENLDFKNIPLVDYLKSNRREQRILAQHLKAVDRPKGGVIVSEGDPANSLFILVQGTCRVLVGGVEIAKISNRGAIIGEAIVFEKKNRKRTATVIAETSCRLLEIQRKDLGKLKTAYPKLRRLLANVLIQRKNSVGNNVFGLEIFNGINPEDIRIFLADKASEKKFSAGDCLIRQGKKTAGVYILIRGSVILSQAKPDSETEPIELSDKPLEFGLFGERSVILNTGAICTVKAHKETVALFIGKNDFQKLLNHHPQLLRNCLNHISDYSRLNRERVSLISSLEKRMLGSD
ncbi:MAG: cyclic nucleotide-binding domain-containing protein [bacterium]|nr:cyclic nucleotide-binding domain-containing protein [bacterium]